jgi:uncharacterized SAM-binding protein YcdF (DUF218 family)
VSIRWLLWSLLSPSQLLLAAIIVGSLLLAFGRLRAGRILCLLGGAGLLVFGLLPAAHYLVHPLEARFPRTELPPRIAGIVLLSGAERPAVSEAYGEPQVGAHGSRYIAALRLAAKYPEARLVYTGGSRVEPGRGPLGTQTAVASEILGSVGVDPDRVSFEEQSRDTCDNATNTRALVRPRPDQTWVVVTSAMHMPRTMACFRAAGWEVTPYPTDYKVVIGPWDAGSFQMADNLALLDMAAHEWVGLAYYRLSGRTQEFFPAPKKFDPSRASP